MFNFSFDIRGEKRHLLGAEVEALQIPVGEVWGFAQLVEAFEWWFVE